MNNSLVEILAPAGSMESLKAAVRCGADAVYLGTTSLNARAGADNFDKTLLKQAVSYCHARGIEVHLTLNTIVFEKELRLAEQAVQTGAEAGVDAFIIQDLSMLHLAKACAPKIKRHASTQMSVHNLEGVLALEKLGFHRVVLAREVSLEETQYICEHSPIEVETFVHGALCVSVSGQCYLSSIIGGRSGNRGRCAQPCRLPFAVEGETHALSLKDLSLIHKFWDLKAAGVSSFKIEGRLKRPEYVAAAVTACVDIKEGRQPDYATLEAIFSRSGFTDGYYTGNLGEDMFGTRTRDDVVSAEGTLKELAGLYHNEQPRIPVDFHIILKENQPSLLTATSNGVSVTVENQSPELARKVATTPERTLAALEKTGNTPFYLNEYSYDIDDNIMMPVSLINALRRDALDALIATLETPRPKSFTPYNWGEHKPKGSPTKQETRGRFENIDAMWETAPEDLDRIILPINQINLLKGELVERYHDKIILQLPRVIFSAKGMATLKTQLYSALEKGITHVLTGNIGGIYIAQKLGFKVHGDFGLNVVNSLALKEYLDLGLEDVNLSFEYDLAPLDYNNKGLLVYGYLPVMLYRNSPKGFSSDEGFLTDRLGNDFLVKEQGEAFEMYNCVPLSVGDQLKELKEFDFLTLYFTRETSKEAEEVYNRFITNRLPHGSYTKGLYWRQVL